MLAAPQIIYTSSKSTEPFLEKLRQGTGPNPGATHFDVRLEKANTFSPDAVCPTHQILSTYPVNSCRARREPGEGDLLHLYSFIAPLGQLCCNRYHSHTPCYCPQNDKSNGMHVDLILIRIHYTTMAADAELMSRARVVGCPQCQLLPHLNNHCAAKTSNSYKARNEYIKCGS